jgi:hypothetical protein
MELRGEEDARPEDSPALPDSGRPDEDDDRGAIGENFCHPPLLALSRAPVELELPGLEARFELARASEPRSEFWFARCNPSFELVREFMPEFVFERLNAVERLFAAPLALRFVP